MAINNAEDNAQLAWARVRVTRKAYAGTASRKVVVALAGNAGSPRLATKLAQAGHLTFGVSVRPDLMLEKFAGQVVSIGYNPENVADTEFGNVSVVAGAIKIFALGRQKLEEPVTLMAGWQKEAKTEAELAGRRLEGVKEIPF